MLKTKEINTQNSSFYTYFTTFTATTLLKLFMPVVSVGGNTI